MNQHYIDLGIDTFFLYPHTLPSLTSGNWKGSPDLQNVLAYEELEHVDRNSREPLAHLLWSRGTAEFTVLGIIVTGANFLVTFSMPAC